MMSSPAERVYNHTVMVQQAISMITYNLFAYLNPYDGCITNNSVVDYIIVGGGTSGCVLANRLSADKRNKVLLIEAGGDFDATNGYPMLLLYNGNTKYDWNYTSTNDGFTNQCHRSKVFEPIVGHVLGGTSSTDFMFHSQGYMEDYEAWADLTGEEAWRFDNVQRLLKKVENFQDPALAASPDSVYHGFEGNLNLTKDYVPDIERYITAFKEVGHDIVEDINNRTRLGYTRAVYYIHNVGRQNSALAYLYPVRDRENLIVLKHTMVTKLKIKNRRAFGVEAFNTKLKQRFVFYSRKEVIVAAGTFNTVKLLQLSGVGPRHLLQRFGIDVISDLPVGCNYQDHVGVAVNFRTKKTTRRNTPQDMNPHKYPAGTIWGFVALNKSQNLPDYKTNSFIILEANPIILLQYTATVYRYDFYISDCLYKKNIGRELLYTRIENLRSKSRGKVEIASKDPFAKPYFETGFFTEKEDLKNMVKYVKEFHKVGQSKYFKKIGAAFSDGTRKCKKLKFGSDEYWECYVLCMMTGLSYSGGTAAMGSVTDGRMRVYGVCSLRVVDASAMPVLVRGCTTVPTMMMAENAAEMIMEDEYRRNYKW